MHSYAQIAKEDNEGEPDQEPAAASPSAEEPLWLPDADVLAIMKVHITLLPYCVVGRLVS